ncbi:hypothetical protein ABTY61_22710 [Kitasatospora sp. NPDC096128]|uniref:hypothetical protein n=1 Tax=Kitasatospora sp. NPDC096128 TaxID=3155547 RepID=UPI003316BACA
MAEVMAGELDPTWLGRVLEVTEEGPDGPLVHGMRLVSYRRVTGRDVVVLVGENTSVVVGSGVVLVFFVEAAVPGRFTGAVAEGGGWSGGPAVGGGYAAAAGPGGWPVAGGQEAAVVPVAPVVPPGVPGAPAVPWMRPRPGP